MLSILIPIYNFDVRQLVAELEQQCISAGAAYEIICLDDKSEEAFRQKNRAVQSLLHVHYEELSENLGRSRIRNRLADLARYPYLLFMDCDSKVVKKDYIQTYLKWVEPDRLLYGGRIYTDQPPTELQFSLHWTYGREREQIPTAKRNQAPYQSFMTNNFLIPKSIFQTIRFDENIRQYGHEDTLFGLELQKHQIPILHLDNPLEHIGLESSQEFLRKTDLAIQNLCKLLESGKSIKTRLLDFYEKCEGWRLLGIINSLFLLNYNLLIQYFLKSRKPNLNVFDFYKVGLLIKYRRKG